MKLRINTAILRNIEPGKNYFQALTRSIIYQQLSGKAAGTIYKRFVALFAPKKFPRPEDIAAMSDMQLRSVGLSRGKIVYIRDLAAKFLDGTINQRTLPKMSDQEVIDHVTSVKGIGLWTAHMFLIFTLNRPDILPTGDLAIKKGFQQAFKLDHLPDHSEMEALASAHAGERTKLSLYLWHIVDIANGGSEW